MKWHSTKRKDSCGIYSNDSIGDKSKNSPFFSKKLKVKPAHWITRWRICYCLQIIGYGFHGANHHFTIKTISTSFIDSKNGESGEQKQKKNKKLLYHLIKDSEL
jgi:hypothetical protein